MTNNYGTMDKSESKCNFNQSIRKLTFNSNIKKKNRINNVRLIIFWQWLVLKTEDSVVQYQMNAGVFIKALFRLLAPSLLALFKAYTLIRIRIQRVT